MKKERREGRAHIATHSNVIDVLNGKLLNKAFEHIPRLLRNDIVVNLRGGESVRVSDCAGATAFIFFRADVPH